MQHQTLDGKSWEDILADDGYRWTPPYSVHIPIQPVHAPDFLHVDAALNVCRRHVLPPTCTPQDMETLLVQFALGDPPLVPDFRHTQLHLAEGGLPIITAENYSSDLQVSDEILYRITYTSIPIDDLTHSMLCVQCTLENTGELPRTAHLRMKVSVQREQDFFPDHYYPFTWDASNWQPCTRVKWDGHNVLLDGQAIGRVLTDDGISVQWESEASFPDERFNPIGERVTPIRQLRLHAVQDVLHFATELAPGEQRTCTLLLLTNYEDIAPTHRAQLAKTDVTDVFKTARQHFQGYLPTEMTRVVCPIAQWDEIVPALQLSIQQLLVQQPGFPGLVPTQGGTSARHLVWTWEAIHMLRPMLRLGQFAAVHDGLEFLFSLQDAGFSPKGHFTTTEGSIGTTGPRWANTTGSTLGLAAAYFTYVRDEEFLQRLLPQILRAMDWIAGELRATRVLNTDGTRPPTYGLMPFACATDGDIGNVVAFTDAYTYWGFDATATLLERLQHPRATEFRREAEHYRADIVTAITYLTRPDGLIERKITAGCDDEQHTSKFDACCSFANMIVTGIPDMISEAFSRYVSYMEAHVVCDQFWGPMDREVMYMGNAEHAWQQIYLERGEWKKAFMTMRTNQRYGMTPDTFQTQERFSIYDPGFTPFQPNGSGNGRMLEMILNSLYYEGKDTVVLFGCIPFAWLRRNGITSVRNLHTPQGRIHLEATMLDRNTCRISLTGTTSDAMPATVRLPEHLHVDFHEGVTPMTAQQYAIMPDMTTITFTVSDGEAVLCQ